MNLQYFYHQQHLASKWGNHVLPLIHMPAMYDAFKSAVVHALCIKFLCPLASFQQAIVF